MLNFVSCNQPLNNTQLYVEKHNSNDVITTIIIQGIVKQDLHTQVSHMTI